MKKISLVMPFFNEQQSVLNTLAQLEKQLNGSTYTWELVAINDGSSDETLVMLSSYRPVNFDLRLIDLSRNFGKEAALSAGLNHATGDAVIPLDADLQDPPALIPEMLAKWEQGYEVVLAKRVDRSSDSALKRISAKNFYILINRLSDVAIPQDVGDFRLMDRAVVDALCLLTENRRFMKGLFAWAGFRTTTVEYFRPPRVLGDSKFNGWKLWNLAVEGITSFSTVPLRIWTYIGFAIASISFLYGIITIIKTLIFGISAPGYASIITVILFTSGIQLLGLGVIGEYLGRTYIEAKRRPPYLVRSVSITAATCNPELDKNWESLETP